MGWIRCKVCGYLRETLGNDRLLKATSLYVEAPCDDCIAWKKGEE